MTQARLFFLIMILFWASSIWAQEDLFAEAAGAAVFAENIDHSPLRKRPLHYFGLNMVGKGLVYGYRIKDIDFIEIRLSEGKGGDQFVDDYRTPDQIQKIDVYETYNLNLSLGLLRQVPISLSGWSWIIGANIGLQRSDYLIVYYPKLCGPLWCGYDPQTSTSLTYRQDSLNLRTQIGLITNMFNVFGQNGVVSVSIEPPLLSTADNDPLPPENAEIKIVEKLRYHLEAIVYF